MWYVEHALEVFSRKGRMVPLSDISRYYGFRSVYAFSQEDAEEIKKSRSSKGFNRFSVFSDKLLFDLDNGDQGLNDIIGWADNEGFGYEIYESGSKGLHVELPTVAKYSPSLPGTHKEIAKKIYPKADLSIYRHGSLYRLPGTIHKKTGNPKKLVESVQSNILLDFELKTEEPKIKALEIDPSEDAQLALALASSLFNNSPGCGGRYMKFWSTSRALVDAGFSEEFIVELMLRINESWDDDAHEESEVLRAVSGAFV